MNASRPIAPIRPAVLEEAGAWLIEFRAGSPKARDRREFDTWLRASPEHVRAYLTLLPTWENEALVGGASGQSVETLRAWARAGDDNVIALSAASRSARRPVFLNRRAGWLASAASVLLLAAAAAIGWMTFHRPSYATGTGEQRAIELEEGQALFKVAKDPHRPFLIESGGILIRAVGTQFDVYRKSADTVVTVLEGRVAVLPSAVAGPIYLDAGQQLTIDPGLQTSRAPRVPAHADLRATTAWTRHRLIFSATPLTGVAAEFNRYNTRRLVIDSAALAAFRLNGVFSSADPSALLSFLREQPGIAVAESDREIRISQK